MIIGFSGCGKSTLARQMGEILGIEPTHMDALHWLPGWVESSREYKIELLKPVLEREKWIVEGSYRKVLWRERFEKADTIIFLDFNRFLCLWRIIKRRIMYNNKTRPDMGKDCKEKLDFEFLKWVVRDGRKKRKSNYGLLNFLENEKQKNVYIFKSPRELEKFLQNIKISTKGMAN